MQATVVNGVLSLRAAYIVYDDADENYRKNGNLSYTLLDEAGLISELDNIETAVNAEEGLS